MAVALSDTASSVNRATICVRSDTALRDCTLQPTAPSRSARYTENGKDEHDDAVPVSAYNVHAGVHVRIGQARPASRRNWCEEHR